MRRILIATALSLPLAAFAASNTIDKIVSTPTPGKAGSPISVTISAAEADGGMCGMEVEWGDGAVTKKQMGGNHPNFPITLEHTYAKPGDYRIKASGKRIDTYLGCMGQFRHIVKIEGGAAAAAAGGTCPEGWGMKGKAAKDGSFTCTPKAKGAKKPEKELACPAGTSYFVSNSKLGCEKSQ